MREMWLKRNPKKKKQIVKREIEKVCVCGGGLETERQKEDGEREVDE